MAKKSQIARQKKRQQLVARFAEKRQHLKTIGDWEALTRLPRNSSAARLRNRCFVTGRARGYMRRFGVSRIVFREEALQGNIPGVVKASW